MKSFFNYFFGKGEAVEFNNFTFAHFAPILASAGVIFLIFYFRERIAKVAYERTLRYVMAFTMIVCEMSYFWRLVGMSSVLEPNPVDHLPITVCGWAIIFGSFMLLDKSQTLFDICYFWVFAGTIFALITPTVITYTGPTRFRYYQFWTEHLMGYIAIFYMIFVHKLRPTVKSLIKSYVALTVLGVVAIFANNIIGPGANYLFMAKPESTPSILDILPSNYALRIFIMALVVTSLFVLSYVPWFIMDRKARKRAQVDEEEKSEATVG